MTTDELIALLWTRKPFRSDVYDRATMTATHRYSWAHELSYNDGPVTPTNFLPGPLFDLLPGVKTGPRFPVGVLAGCTPNPAECDYYTAYYATEREAYTALWSAASRLLTAPVG